MSTKTAREVMRDAFAAAFMAGHVRYGHTEELVQDVLVTELDKLGFVMMPKEATLEIAKAFETAVKAAHEQLGKPLQFTALAFMDGYHAMIAAASPPPQEKDSK